MQEAIEMTVSSGNQIKVADRVDPHASVCAVRDALRDPNVTLEVLKKNATVPSGEVYGFEYEACDFIKWKATSIEQVRDIIALVLASPQYLHTFAPGDRVVYLSNANGLTVGTVYTVHTCYIGSHWGGPTEWVKLRNRDGGLDPDNFVHADLYNAVKEARMGSGVLFRYGDRWMRPPAPGGEIAPEAAEITQETVERLVSRGALRVMGQTAFLRERSRLVKKCGFALPVQQQVRKLLRDNMLLDPDNLADLIVKEFGLS